MCIRKSRKKNREVSTVRIVDKAVLRSVFVVLIVVLIIDAPPSTNMHLNTHTHTHTYIYAQTLHSIHLNTSSVIW